VGLFSKSWSNFKCESCGKCCTQIGLPYDAGFIGRLSDYFGDDVVQLVSKYYGQVSSDGKSIEFDESKRTPCPFLKKNDDLLLCSIYNIRPEGCRLYPIETDWADGGISCPGYLRVLEKLKTIEGEIL